MLIHSLLTTLTKFVFVKAFFMLTGKREANIILLLLRPCMGAKVITSGGKTFYRVFLVNLF